MVPLAPFLVHHLLENSIEDLVDGLNLDISLRVIGGAELIFKL